MTNPTTAIERACHLLRSMADHPVLASRGTARLREGADLIESMPAPREAWATSFIDSILVLLDAHADLLRPDLQPGELADMIGSLRAVRLALLAEATA